VLRLDADDAPGGVAQEERSIAENVREREIDVKVTSLPVLRGAVITVEEVAGDFRSRSEVRAISIGADGVPHLSLFVLDAPVPPRLLPSADHDEPPSET
jgi:hypothetical protein